MFLIDSHCHLDRFPDVEDRLARARQNGVHRFLSISTGPDTFQALQPIIENHADVYGTVGLHPCDINSLHQESVYSWLAQGLSHDKIVGIGETGLDALPSSPDMNMQKNYFREHIRAAIEFNLPLIVHTRHSDAAFLSVMQDIRQNIPNGDRVRGVLHCFTGSLACAQTVIDWGWKVSFSGILTFKNARELQDMARLLPLSALLIETDAPWLAPHPYRGQRNEPAYIIETAHMLASLKNVSISEIAQTTTANFFELFGKIPPCQDAASGTIHDHPQF